MDCNSLLVVIVTKPCAIFHCRYKKQDRQTVVTLATGNIKKGSAGSSGNVGIAVTGLHLEELAHGNVVQAITTVEDHTLFG